MLPRDRILSALNFRRPDVIPLRIAPALGGFNDHGQKLLDLTKRCGHDFGDLSGLALPEPPKPEDFDADGKYHVFRTDDWGTRWEFRIYGVWGHPVVWPLADMKALDTYKVPGTAPSSGPEFDAAKARAEAHRKTYFHLDGGGGLFETMFSLRPFEDVCMDIMEDTPEINHLADMLTQRNLKVIERSVALGADGVAFGNDFGTQQAPIFSMPVFRRFFKPRFAAMVAPVLKAGKRAFLHSCGQIWPLLEDLREIGFTAIWPQMPLYKPSELAARCRELGMAVELHPDRGDLMQRGTPQQVRDYVLRLVDEFKTAEGGSWLYIEIDPNFPWPNVEALFNVAMELRR